MRYLYFVKVAHTFRYVDGDYFSKMRPIKTLKTFLSKEEALQFTRQTKAPEFINPFQEFFYFHDLILRNYYDHEFCLKELVRFCRKHNLPDPAKELTRALHIHPFYNYRLQDVLHAWWEEAYYEMTLEQHQFFWNLIGYAPFEIFEVELA